MNEHSETLILSEFLILQKQDLITMICTLWLFFKHELSFPIYTTKTYPGEVFLWQDEKVSAPEIWSDMLKTKQQTYWHDKCESFCLKSLSITCRRLLR